MPRYFAAAQNMVLLLEKAVEAQSAKEARQKIAAAIGTTI